MQIAATNPWSHRNGRPWATTAIFSAGLAGKPVTWLAPLLLKAGDIESNPGPPRIWTCELCTQKITRRQTSVLCNTHPSHWVHIKCANIKTKEHTKTWMCKNHDTTDKRHSKETTWMCILCNTEIKQRQTSILCNHQEKHWVHSKCTKTKLKEYSGDWTCTKHTTAENTQNKVLVLPNTGARSKESSNNNNGKTDKKRKKKEINNNKSNNNNKKNDNKNRENSNNINVKILQLNINGIQSKMVELEQLTKELSPDVICIQETTLNKDQKTPQLQGYTSEAINRERKGAGVATFIHEDLKYIRLKTLAARDAAQIIKVQLHLNPKTSIVISNLYITPTHLPAQEDDVIIIQYLREAMKENAIVTSDVNAHSQSWYEEDDTDHRGRQIEEIVAQSDQIIINENNPTRIPFNRGNNQSEQKHSQITRKVTGQIYYYLQQNK